MAVLNAQYKHPSSAYTQGLKDLIDSMLRANPSERPDIHRVSGAILIIRCRVILVEALLTHSPSLLR